MADITITLSAEGAVKESERLYAALTKLEKKSKTIENAFANMKVKLNLSGVEGQIKALETKLTSLSKVATVNIAAKVTGVNAQIKALRSRMARERPIKLTTELGFTGIKTQYKDIKQAMGWISKANPIILHWRFSKRPLGGFPKGGGPGGGGTPRGGGGRRPVPGAGASQREWDKYFKSLPKKELDQLTKDVGEMIEEQDFKYREDFGARIPKEKDYLPAPRRPKGMKEGSAAESRWFQKNLLDYDMAKAPSEKERGALWDLQSYVLNRPPDLRLIEGGKKPEGEAPGWFVEKKGSELSDEPAKRRAQIEKHITDIKKEQKKIADEIAWEAKEQATFEKAQVDLQKQSNALDKEEFGLKQQSKRLSDKIAKDGMTGIAQREDKVRKEMDQIQKELSAKTKPGELAPDLSLEEQTHYAERLNKLGKEADAIEEMKSKSIERTTKLTEEKAAIDKRIGDIGQKRFKLEDKMDQAQAMILQSEEEQLNLQRMYKKNQDAILKSEHMLEQTKQAELATDKAITAEKTKQAGIIQGTSGPKPGGFQERIGKLTSELDTISGVAGEKDIRNKEALLKNISSIQKKALGIQKEITNAVNEGTLCLEAAAGFHDDINNVIDRTMKGEKFITGEKKQQLATTKTASETSTKTITTTPYKQVVDMNKESLGILNETMFISDMLANKTSLSKKEEKNLEKQLEGIIKRVNSLKEGGLLLEQLITKEEAKQVALQTAKTAAPATKAVAAGKGLVHPAALDLLGIPKNYEEEYAKYIEKRNTVFRELENQRKRFLKLAKAYRKIGLDKKGMASMRDAGVKAEILGQKLRDLDSQFKEIVGKKSPYDIIGEVTREQASGVRAITGGKGKYTGDFAGSVEEEKDRVDGLTKAIESSNLSKREQASVNKMVADTQERSADLTDKIARSTGTLEQQFKKERAYLGQLNQAFIDGEISGEEYRKKLKGVNKRMRDFEKQVKRVGKAGGIMGTMFGKLTMTLTAIAASLFILQELRQYITALVSIGAKYSDILTRIQADTQITREETDALAEQMRDMAKGTVFSIEDLYGAYKELRKEGLDYESAMNKAVMTSKIARNENLKLADAAHIAAYNVGGLADYYQRYNDIASQTTAADAWAMMKKDVREVIENLYRSKEPLFIGAIRSLGPALVILVGTAVTLTAMFAAALSPVVAILGALGEMAKVIKKMPQLKFWGEGAEESAESKLERLTDAFLKQYDKSYKTAAQRYAKSFEDLSPEMMMGAEPIVPKPFEETKDIVDKLNDALSGTDEELKKAAQALIAYKKIVAELKDKPLEPKERIQLLNDAYKKVGITAGELWKEQSSLIKRNYENLKKLGFAQAELVYWIDKVNQRRAAEKPWMDAQKKFFATIGDTQLKYWQNRSDMIKEDIKLLRESGQLSEEQAAEYEQRLQRMLRAEKRKPKLEAEKGIFDEVGIMDQWLEKRKRISAWTAKTDAIRKGVPETYAELKYRNDIIKIEEEKLAKQLELNNEYFDAIGKMSDEHRKLEYHKMVLQFERLSEVYGWSFDKVAELMDEWLMQLEERAIQPTLDMYREMYDDMWYMTQDFYDKELTLIENRRKRIERTTGDKAAADKTFQRDLERTRIKVLRSGKGEGTQVDQGILAGMKELALDAEPLANKIADAFIKGATDAEQAWKSLFFDTMEMNFDNLGDTALQFLKAIQRGMIDILYQQTMYGDTGLITLLKGKSSDIIEKALGPKQGPLTPEEMALQTGAPAAITDRRINAMPVDNTIDFGGGVAGTMDVATKKSAEATARETNIAALEKENTLIAQHTQAEAALVAAMGNTTQACHTQAVAWDELTEKMRQYMIVQNQISLSGGSNLLGGGLEAGAKAISIPGQGTAIVNKSGVIYGMQHGGWITEPILGVGQNTGAKYSLGEAGPELVSPASKVPKGGGGMGVPNVKVEVQNKTGVDADAKQGEVRWDGDQWVVGVIMDAYTRDRYGMRSMMKR